MEKIIRSIAVILLIATFNARAETTGADTNPCFKGGDISNDPASISDHDIDEAAITATKICQLKGVCMSDVQSDAQLAMATAKTDPGINQNFDSTAKVAYETVRYLNSRRNHCGQAFGYCSRKCNVKMGKLDDPACKVRCGPANLEQYQAMTTSAASLKPTADKYEGESSALSSLAPD